MKFISNRDIVFRSLIGHSIEFKKGVPVEVNVKALHSKLLEVGILPDESEGKPGEVAPLPEPNAPKLAPEDGEERADLITEVVIAMVDRNNSQDFTAGGHPNAEAVSAALGWKTDQKEVSAVWSATRGKGK